MAEKRVRPTIRFVAWGLAALATTMIAVPVIASVESPNYSIPAERLKRALKEFAEQSGLQLMYAPDAVRDRRGRPVTGTYSPRQALDLLLEGSGLGYEFTDQNTVVIHPKNIESAQTPNPRRMVVVRPRPPHRPRHPPGASKTGATLFGDSKEPLAEVTITGSRIRQMGLSTPTPVTALSDSELVAMAPGSLINALDQIPSFFNNQNASTDFGTNVTSAGGTNLNLRGLGRNRTLTLLDGRRVVPNSKEGTVNIDILPSAVVKRVEIVTGGASAVYGTDAVAGVVNFVLDTGFSGFKGNVQAGISKRADNENGEVDLAYGTDIGDRIHLVLSGEYARENGIKDWTDLDWYQGYAEIANPNPGPKLITVPDVVGREFTCGGLINAPGSALDRLEFLPDGSTAPYVDSKVAGVVGQSLAYGGGSGCDPKRISVEGDGPRVSNDLNRGTAFSYVDFAVSDRVRLYSQLLFSRDLVGMNGASSVLAGVWAGTIFSNNAFLPENVRGIMSQEGVDSFAFERHTRELLTDAHLVQRNRALSVTTGFKADIDNGSAFDGWHLDGYYQYAENNLRYQFFGFIRTQTLPLALDAVRDPGTGRIVCHAALLNPGQFGDCVPIDLFGVGRASEAARRYVTTPTDPADAVTHRFQVTEQDAEVTASGEIWQGWGAGAVSGAFGSSYRRQTLTSRETGAGANASTPTNDVLGVRGVPPGFAGDPDIQQFGSFSDVDGGFDVWELYGETLVPLVAGAPLVHQLNATAALRWADYQGSGTIWSYKLGLEWELSRELRFRGTYSRDVRAATLAERFDTQRADGRIQNDPVTGKTYSFSQTNGGNPEVDPEKADTFTFGTVYQPAWLGGFAATVDWYQIGIGNAIGQLDTQRIVEDCFAGVQDLCALITRDPVSHLITNLRNVFININKEKASGIDVELEYASGVNLFGDPESVEFRWFGSWLLERSTTEPGGPKYDHVGEIPAGGDIRYAAYPKFQWTGNLTYRIGAFDIGLEERYIDGGKRNLSYVEGVDVDNNSVAPRWYTDLRLYYTRQGSMGPSWQLYCQVFNLFNEAPPLAPATFSTIGGSSQTNTQLYDIKGRRFIVGARFRY